jgi:diguanylate cyclase (GGDEF)-like protein
MTWLAFAGGVAGALLWTLRWPTHGQSVAFAFVSSASVMLACLAHPDPLASLIGCIAFALFGGYIAFFHTSKYVLCNFAVAAFVSVFAATRLALSGHAALAGVDLWLVLQINIVLPAAIHVLIRVLGTDLVHADRDPLTGLLNRRAFEQEALGLLLDRPTHADSLVVAVIDLDCFKAVNDNHGHAAGDRALSEVSHALRGASCETAVIGRSGGEEFVVADTSSNAHAGPSLARRLCDAIADLPVPITASVGSACAPLDGLSQHQYQTLIDELIRAADEAMYSAKRKGGNQIHHHCVNA